MGGILYNYHDQLNKFYDDKVYLSELEKNNLRKYRDINLKRVKGGADKLSEENGISCANFIEDRGQGSMAMHTINQAQHNENHDIDHALIYREEDISRDPKKAREFVARSINSVSGNFKKEPEAKTNAVTVWYEEGYHVDFAVYRKRTDNWGETIIEHAGNEWVKRDPSSITNWFNERVSLLSPNPEHYPTKVRKKQLRRIIRLLKYWSKSRSGWSLPSGLALSVLAVECYKPDCDRDDQAFYDTILNIAERLKYNKEVLNPTDNSVSLIVKEKDKKQIETLEKRLNLWIKKLEPLFDLYCSEEKAVKVWRKFFRQRLQKNIKEVQEVKFLSVKVVVSDKKGRKSYNYDPDGTEVIQKNMSIQFVASTRLRQPYQIEWEVRNTGDEAEFKGEEIPRQGLVNEKNFHLCKEATAYKGDHLMICRLKQDDEIVAESQLTFE